MPEEYMRVFKLLDFEDVKKHLLILGDLSSDCGACREIGLDSSAAVCPNCGCGFKYVTSRRLQAHPGERFRIVRRYLEKNPYAVFIDYEDYDKLHGKKKVRDIFGD